MKIYFIYSKRLDTVLNIGKGKNFSGYMTRNKAISELEFFFKYRKDWGDDMFFLWRGKKRLTHTKKDWEIVEMELK